MGCGGKLPGGMKDFVPSKSAEAFHQAIKQYDPLFKDIAKQRGFSNGIWWSLKFLVVMGIVLYILVSL